MLEKSEQEQIQQKVYERKGKAEREVGSSFWKLGGSSASEHGGARDGRRAPSVHDTLRVLGRAEAVLLEVTAAKKSLQATLDAARAARGTAA